MEALKDIFVPYEIAVQLNEIGFDEECMGYYMEYDGELYLDVEDLDFFEYCSTNISNIYITNHNRYGNQISAPTWEQVKKWFREKGYFCNIHIIEGLEKTFLFTINKEKRIYESDLCTAYETAREILIYKLIEIYEKGK